MKFYLDLFLLAVIVVYIVDLSGWTDTWLGWLSRFTAHYGHGPVRSLRPFSCSRCMVWWSTIGVLIFSGSLTIGSTLYAAGLSYFSNTICEVLIIIHEGLTALVVKIGDKWIGKK